MAIGFLKVSLSKMWYTYCESKKWKLCLDLSRSVTWSALISYWPSLWSLTVMLWQKSYIHQPTHHRICASSTNLSLDTSLSNTNCGLAPTTNSTFKSMLVCIRRPTDSVQLHTHQLTATAFLPTSQLVCAQQLAGVCIALWNCGVKICWLINCAYPLLYVYWQLFG